MSCFNFLFFSLFCPLCVLGAFSRWKPVPASSQVIGRHRLGILLKKTGFTMADWQMILESYVQLMASTVHLLTAQHVSFLYIQASKKLQHQLHTPTQHKTTNSGKWKHPHILSKKARFSLIIYWPISVCWVDVYSSSVTVTIPSWFSVIFNTGF